MDMHAKDTHSHAAPASAVTRDPVCGMIVDMAKTPHRTTYEGREIGFCSGGCKTKFEAEPAKYLSATDPVCGMRVDRASAKHMLKHEGARYYFCSEGCKTKFEEDPAKYLEGAGGEHHGHHHHGHGGPPVDFGDRPQGHAVDLPDAPGDRQRRAGRLPDLRHGARADGGFARRRPEPGTGRFHPPHVGERGALGPDHGARDGRHGRAAGARMGGRTALQLARSSRSRRPWCCGRASRFYGASGTRSGTARPTCGR